MKSYEAKSSQRSGSASPAASTGAPAAPLVFPGKVKPPPPNVAQTSGMPGYAHSRLWPLPPKGEAPKPPSVVEAPKTPPKIGGPKTPPKADAPKTPPKEGASAPSAPEVPKAVTAAVEPAKEDEPAKKKAALSIEPAAVPAASSAAAFLELFRRLRFQRPVQKNKRFLLQDPHHQSRLQAQSHLCQNRSLALKAMTNHQRRTSRCPSRLRPNNANDVLQKPSKDNLNVTSAD